MIKIIFILSFVLLLCKHLPRDKEQRRGATPNGKQCEMVVKPAGAAKKFPPVRLSSKNNQIAHRNKPKINFNEIA